jgi:hypothetical protein
MNPLHGFCVLFTGVVNVLRDLAVQVNQRLCEMLFSAAPRARKLCTAAENVKLEIGSSISPSAFN